MDLSRVTEPRRLALVSFVVGLAVLAIAQLATTNGTVARQNPSIHVALDLIEGMIALLIAYLMVARVRDRGDPSDALALYALVTLGLSKIVLLGLPTVAAGNPRRPPTSVRAHRAGDRSGCTGVRGGASPAPWQFACRRRS